MVELKHLDRAAHEGESRDLERWARFLRFDDERELDSLARESPIMAEAKQALEILSREPSAQRIAEMRREAELARRLDRAEDLAEGREQGLAEGREQGLVEGREQALRKSVESFCAAVGIDLDDQRRASLQALDEAGLTALLEALYAERAWP